MSEQHDHHIPDRPAVLAHPSSYRVEPPTIELAGCPACDQPAEIINRVVLESTSGPIEHVRIRCLFGHAFFMPVRLLHDLAEA